MATEGWKVAEPEPDAAPTEHEIDRRVQFDALLAAAPAGVQKSAEKWSAGLLALIGLIMASILVKGPSTASEIAPEWHWPLTILVALALVSALSALWKLLAVSARRFEITSRSDLFGEPGQYEHKQRTAVTKDATAVKWAIRLGAAALVLQVVAVIVWSMTPSPAKSPAAYLSVETAGAKVCGEVLSGDKGELRVEVAGERDPRVVPWNAVTNLRVVDKC